MNHITPPIYLSKFILHKIDNENNKIKINT